MINFRGLETRTAVLLVAIFCLGFVFQLTLRQFWTLPNLMQLEHEIDIKDAKRLAFSLKSINDDLVAHVLDNAVWDEMYQAVKNRDKGFLKDNYFSGDQFANLKINGYAFYDQDGSLLVEHTVNKALKRISPRDIYNLPFNVRNSLVVSRQEVAANANKAVTHEGIVFIDNQPVMFASSSVMPTENYGVPVGTMVVWRFLDERVLEALQNNSQLSLFVKFVSQESSIEHWDQHPAVSELNIQLDKIKRDHDQMISLVINDFQGAPAALVSFSAHPRIFDASLIDTVLLLNILFAVLIITVIYFGIQRLTVKPVKRISEWINRVIDRQTFEKSKSVSDVADFSAIEHQLNKLMDHMRIQKQDLVALKDEAERANIAKSLFLANMSHEIRTPLHGVLNLAELGIHTNDLHQKNENLDTIYYSAKILMNIVNDILDFSKIEAGKLNIEIIDFDIRETVHSAAAPFKSIVEKKDIELKIAVDSGVSQYVKGDPVRISQVLANLCSNAIKFTSKGGVSIHVGGSNIENNQQTLTFTIKDTGIGIPKEKQSQLFQAFQQVDNSTARKYGGTGLGLSICAKLCELMGGRISFESTPDVGTTFSFLQTFPISTNFQPANKESLELDLKGLTILVAEDNSINQTVLESMLESYDVKLIMVGNGQDCVDYLKENSPDLILMDIQMPGMDGITATKQIRALPHKKKIPIIAMTANVMKEEVESYYAVGMDGYIGKPFEQEQLHELLSVYSSKETKRS